MKFESLAIDSAYLIHPQVVTDDRGAFARLFCTEEFAVRGLNPHIEQCSVSRNRTRGTLRGMHYQEQPHAEAKLVRCQSGASYHVIIDLRATAPSHLSWCSVELSAHSSSSLYIPEGVAHGYLTLEDDTEIFYQMSSRYHADSARGIRWDDPAFNIRWPADVAVISDRDSGYADFSAPS